MDGLYRNQWRSRMLRSGHLAILRFAVTRDNAYRLDLLAAAREIDRLGGSHEDGLISISSEEPAQS